jgi:hypothetical protein
MTKPVPDKAEVAVEYPDKLYIGTFERSSRFDAHLDETGISLTLHRTGDASVRKSVHMHLNYGLFAEILRDLADTAAGKMPGDSTQRESLRAAVELLFRSLENERSSAKKPSGRRAGPENAHDGTHDLSAKEEVLLLHVLE